MSTLRRGLEVGWPWHDWELTGETYATLTWKGAGAKPTEAQILAEVARAVAEEAGEITRATTENTNRRTIETQARSALTANRTFLAIASPSNAQNAAQIKALTRQANGLLRIALQQFDGSD